MDWIASFITIVAKILVGNKNKWGFIFHIVAEIIWIAVSVKHKVWGLLPLAVVTMMISVCSFLKWYHEENNN